MELNKGIVSSKCFEFVGGSLELVAGFFGHLLGDGFSEPEVGVEPGSNCSAALGKLAHLRQFRPDSLDPVSNLLGVPAELLAQGQRSSILGVGSPDFDDVLEFNCLLFERLGQDFESRDEHFVCLEDGCNVHNGREGIV